ncbi:nucleotidyltransferase domain-containing protein [Candidatus Microgenomates bacterium]|nr:nucleotidyltransferase domain-containing protein [Candidatus Microgenomates bacterium]
MDLKNNYQKELKKIVEALKAYKPEKIVLFGSVATGKFRPDSDFDFLIIKKGVDELRKGERYSQVSKLLGSHKLPMDLLVYTPYEIKKRLYLGDPFIKKILSEGQVLYGS